MDKKIPLWQWSAVDLAAGIKAGDIGCREAVSSCIGRMKEVNPGLNAVVIDMTDEALEQADRADAVVKSGVEPGLLHGVPITIKVNVDVKGKPNSNGIKALADFIAPDDSPLVRNLKKAGAIIIGMTNTPEFSFRMMTDNPLYGMTKNPWDEKYTCGGSSGGAASGVAAGICPVAHGNDIGGSLRIPSFCCGLSTIRPILGRVPAYNPSQTDERGLAAQLFSVQGPIAREVRDIRLALAVMSQSDVRDPWWVPAPLIGPPLTKPIRVAVVKTPGGHTPHPVIAQALDTAAEHLAEAGYEVQEAEAPLLNEIFDLWNSLIFTEMRQLLDQVVKEYGSREFQALLANYYKMTNFLDLEGYMRAMMTRTTYLRTWLMFLEKYPLVLTPLSLLPSFQVNEDLESDEKVVELFSALKPSLAMNFLGLPAAVAPIGLDRGVPHGVQIVGRRFREDLCLDAAEVIQNKVGILARQLWTK